MDSHSPFRVGILTVSDRCSEGEAEDKSGDTLTSFIKSEWSQFARVAVRDCIPDETVEIRNVLKNWADEGHVDVILTTGGTGFAPRDVTPEATKSVLDKEAPGLVVAMIQGSLQSTPMAMLARPVCGVRGKTIIVNLPGSVKGAMENFQIIQKQLIHAVDLLRNSKSSFEAQHSKLQKEGLKTFPFPLQSEQQFISSLKSKVNPVNVADRARRSPFESIKVDRAQQIVIEECQHFVETEMRNLRNSLGYILAQDVYAKEPLPPFPASVKDGYAIKVSADGIIDCLNVRGDSTAGENPSKFSSVEENYCIRVSTGAPVPQGANAVIQIEDTELIERTEDGNDEKIIRITSSPKIGQDIRKVGSDIAKGEKVLIRGTKLGPSELGILATVGVTSFLCFRKPIVSLLSTGNELIDPNEVSLSGGKIRDSNKTTLEALLHQEGFNTKDIGIAKDTPQALLDKLCEGLSQSDVLVCTGGVSMGERDYMKRILKIDLNAEIHIGSVLMKPGKPTTFATCIFNDRKKFIFGLPGNPVSATVTAFLFLIPACRTISGWSHSFHPLIKVQTDKDFKLDSTRPEYHRVSISWATSSGIPLAQSTGNQMSSRLLSLKNADALLILPQGTPELTTITSSATLLDAILLST